MHERRRQDKIPAEEETAEGGLGIILPSNKTGMSRIILKITGIIYECAVRRK